MKVRSRDSGGVARNPCAVYACLREDDLRVVHLRQEIRNGTVSAQLLWTTAPEPSSQALALTQASRPPMQRTGCSANARHPLR